MAVFYDWESTSGTWTQPGVWGLLLHTNSGAGHQRVPVGGYESWQRGDHEVRPGEAVTWMSVGIGAYAQTVLRSLEMHYDLPGIATIDYTMEVDPGTTEVLNGKTVYPTVSSSLVVSFMGVTETLTGFPVGYGPPVGGATNQYMQIQGNFYFPEAEGQFEYTAGEGPDEGPSWTVQNIIPYTGPFPPIPVGNHFAAISVVADPYLPGSSPTLRMRYWSGGSDVTEPTPGTIRNLHVTLCGEGPCEPFEITEQDDALITLATSRGTGWQT